MSNTKKKQRVARAVARARTAVCLVCRSPFVIADHPVWPRCDNNGWVAKVDPLRRTRSMTRDIAACAAGPVMERTSERWGAGRLALAQT
jgi:hypothetical protein